MSGGSTPLSPRGRGGRAPLLVLGVLQVLENAPGAVPVRVLRGLGRDADAEPVVPVVTLVATNHGGSVVLPAARGTDPDLE
jgi:hypothetical protein